MKKQLFIELFAALLILLFLYTSLSKFLNFRLAVHDMYNQPLPLIMKRWLLWAIPVAEILTAAALIWETTRLAGFWAATILMGAFTLYAAVVLLHAFAYIPCSCGGIIRFLNWKQHLVFNIFFLLLSLAGLFFQRSRNIFSTQQKQ